MRTFIVAILIILCLVIQRSFFFLDVGIKPDFLLILVIFYSLLGGTVPGLKIGFAAGLLQDILGGKYFGINILTKIFTAIIIGLIEPKIFKENYLVPVVALFLGTMAHELLFVFFGNMIGMVLPWGTSFWYKIVPLAVYHSVLAPFIYVPFYKFYTSKWFNKEW